eukprot:13390714-Heterocapsa_arctica.AAC.1
MHLLFLTAGCSCWRFGGRRPPDLAVQQDAPAGPDGGMRLLAFWRASAPRRRSAAGGTCWS